MIRGLRIIDGDEFEPNRVQEPSTALNILRQIDIKFVNYGDVSSSGAYTYCSARLLGNGTECSDIGEILKR